MARVLIEYFKPDPREPGAYPLAVIAQDDGAIVYRLFNPRRFHLEKFPEFHLGEREETMKQNVLVESFQRRLPDGRMEVIPPTHPDFLEALAARGESYFRYGRIWPVEDLDAESAADTIATLPEEGVESFVRADQTSTLRELERAVG